MSDDLRVNLTGNRSGFQAMLQGARSEAKKFSSEMGKEMSGGWAISGSKIAASVAGFFGFEALKGHIEGLIQKASELREISEQFDLTTDSVQRWEKATGKAGVTFTTFMRAIETLRQKRQSAGEDFKNLEPFQRVGIGRDEVFKGTDESILLKVLQSGDRAAIADLLGPRGARLKAAVPYIQGMQGKEMPFTPRDIEELHKNELQMKTAQSSLQKFSLKYGPGRWWINMSRRAGAMVSGDWKGMFSGMPIKSEQDITPQGSSVSGFTGHQIGEDEEDRKINTAQAEAKAAKEAKEYADKRAEAEHRVLEAERENMTIADRKLSIEKELLDVKERLHDLDIYGPLTKEEEMERLKLQARGSSLLHELKEKPLNFSADSMSKVGLYSASSLAFNPVLGIQQEQLNELRGIHNTLRVKPDPFQQ